MDFAAYDAKGDQCAVCRALRGDDVRGNAQAGDRLAAIVTALAWPPQLSVSIDRRRAVDLSIEDEAVPILLESASGEINDPSDLVNLYVGTSDGGLLPLSSIVTLVEEGVATELNRQAQRRAIEVGIVIAESLPLQSAVDELRDIAGDVLPAGISMIFLGEAATLEETSNEVALMYMIALLVVFLVLCAQFEGFTSALVVTLIVPFGIAAALFALYLTGTSLNVYSQIGLVLLIGLITKNSVLLVEFADQLRDGGMDVKSAIVAGAERRLRPIMTTVVSTVLGALPLVLSSGAGAEARSAIGWVVFGGLAIAAIFTLYLTPALCALLAPLSRSRVTEAVTVQ